MDFPSRDSSFCSALEATINQRYDTTMYDLLTRDFNRGSDYTNYGYWAPGIDNAKDAGDRLMQELLSAIPAKSGSILDVACGKGETSKYLTRHYSPARITGINISEKQLASCRANVPEAIFLRMDAVSLGFEANAFDAVICVEAAFHFNTRQRFLGEALRVLRPGGYLVLSDILVSRDVVRYHGRTVAENFVEGPEHYGSILQSVGFLPKSVVDATEPCWHGHFRQAVIFGHEQLLRGRLSSEDLKRRLEVYYQRLEYTAHYLLVAAQKT
ncbi:methyltransferase domain-containing protein [Cyanobium sp. FGCU-52]|nr:methyltransferase domain-containing protein [Cyanobium sp. FGCU52]